MVFHYFDGFGPKWIALVIAGGGTLASGATYLYRGGGKSYFDEMNMQDSESSLAPTTKSMQKKVKEVPQGAKASSSSSALLGGGDNNSNNGEQHHQTSSSPPQFNYKDVVASSSTKALSTLTDKADQAAHTFGDTVQAAVNWVAENPKTALSFLLLCYAVQHLARKVLAHEHYEDRLVAERRVAQRPLDSGSPTATTTGTNFENISSDSPASSSSNFHNNNNRQGIPSAVASNADYSTSTNDENDEQDNNKNTTTTNFPVSTWASRERPSHSDPAYEKLLKEELSPEILEEFTSYLLPSMDIQGADADLVAQVRNQLLSIAPAKGWKAEIREEQMFKATSPSSASSPKNETENRENGSDDSLMNTTTNSSGIVIKTKVFRFVDPHGEVKPVHSDAIFALELLQQEASHRERKKLNAKFDITDSN